jgi:hypothetical protein
MQEICKLCHAEGKPKNIGLTSLTAATGLNENQATAELSMGRVIGQLTKES